VQTGIARLDPLLRGTGRISGEVARIGQDRFRAQDLSITTPAIAITANGIGGLTGAAELAATLAVDDATVLDPALNGPIRIDLNATRDADDLADIALTANAPSTDIVIDATVAPPAEGYKVDGTVALNVDDLGRYRTLVGQPIGGADRKRHRRQADCRQRSYQSVGGSGECSFVSAKTEHRVRQHSTGQGRFEARLRDIGLFTDTLSGPVTATGTAQRNANSWGINASASGPGGITANADGTYSDNGQVAMNVDGAAPLGLANNIIAPRRASGDMTFDLAVNGPPALSSVSGEVRLANGQLTAPTLAQSLTDLAGNVRLVAGRAQIALGGAFENGGRISVDGPVNLSSPYQGDVTARLDSIALQDPNLYDTTIDGTITLSGPLAGGAIIAGGLTLGRTELQVPSSGIGALGDLPDVTHIGASNTVRTTLSRADALVSAATQTSTARSGPVYPIDLN